MKLKCGQCSTVHSFNERNIPPNGVKVVRCDGCDNHFLISSDNTVKEKYDFSSRICPNCAKAFPLEVMQCRYCECYFSKEHRLKDNRIKRQQRGTSFLLPRKSMLIRIAIILFFGLAALWYFMMDNGRGPVSQFVRDVSVQLTEDTTSTAPYYTVNLASGGRIYAASYAKKGKLIEIQEENGTLFTIGEEEVVEIVRLR